MCRDERGGGKRSIDFPNAAHGQHDGVHAQASAQHSGSTGRGGLHRSAVGEQRRDLVMLHLHGRDDSYFHEEFFY